ncbi:hypothetical protein EIP91_010991 [Steccherinum ochraceum]|uniref:Cytochrome P450 67 n=1 Tax=Steccherinum ochraceum TaxID=92696 RepID=A0A4R0RMT7_9APHY|nr:hypothetical protein EIP91_010991 [Steccherinum ochraceum]
MITFHSLATINPSLPIALLVVSGAALVVHLIFNRLEPLSLPVPILFFICLPLGLSVLLQPYLSHLAAISTAFLVFHGTLLTSITIYRLSSFHPLAQYPGPIRLKLSSWWVYQMAASGKRHQYICSLHKKYASDVVRIGPNELSLVDVSAIPQIMGSNGLTKGPGWDGHTRYSENRPLIAWRDPAMHAQRRRPWTRAFSTAALKEYEPTLAERTVQLVEMMTRTPGKAVDLAECMRFFSYDFMSDMAFGGGSELMRDGDTHGFIETMHKGVLDAIVAEACPWYAYYVPNSLTTFLRASATRAQERILRGAVRKDVFHFLNHDDRPESSPPLLLVAAEGSMVILAGSDTTAATLSSIMFYLIQDPHSYKKLQNEVDTFYPPGDSALDCKYHSQMPFLEAVINESLRLYPLIPTGSQRATKGDGLALNSCYIPPNTSVRLHTWTIHRDPRNFSPNPDGFWPDRWLIAEDPSSYKGPEPFVHNTTAFIPFSYGPANCAGKNLALKELRMVLCCMMQQVELSFEESYDPDDWDRDMKDFFILDVGRMPVVVKPRSADSMVY